MVNNSSIFVKMVINKVIRCILLIKNIFVFLLCFGVIFIFNGLCVFLCFIVSFVFIVVWGKVFVLFVFIWSYFVIGGWMVILMSLG